MRIIAIISLIGLCFLSIHTTYNMYDSDEWSIPTLVMLVLAISGYVAYIVVTRFGKKILDKVIHYWTLAGFVSIAGITLLVIQMYAGYAKMDIWDTLQQHNYALEYFVRNMIYTLLFYSPVTTVSLCLIYAYRTSPFYTMWLNRRGWSSRLWDDDPRLSQLEQVTGSKNNWLNKEEEAFVAKSLQKKNRGKGISRLTIILLSVAMFLLTCGAITSRMLDEVRMGKKRGKNLLMIAQAPLSKKDRAAILKKLDFSKVIITQDIPMIDLRHAQLNYLNTNKLNLQKADFWHARLNKASFKYCNLSKANLGQAKLDRANFAHARLHNANLCGASLQKASFRQADLYNANLKGADLRKTVLIGAKNLNTANIDSVKVSDKQWFLLQTRWKTGLKADNYKLIPQFDKKLYNDLRKRGRRSAEAKETATFYYVVRK